MVTVVEPPTPAGDDAALRAVNASLVNLVVDLAVGKCQLEEALAAATTAKPRKSRPAGSRPGHLQLAWSAK